MSRTGVFLLLILGAAIVLETVYQLATGGFMGSEAGRYPTPQAFAQEAGLAPRPAPPRPAAARPPVAPTPPPPSGAPASSAAPAAPAQPAKPAAKPSVPKIRAPRRPPPFRVLAELSPAPDTPALPPTPPPRPQPQPQQPPAQPPVTALY